MSRFLHEKEYPGSQDIAFFLLRAKGDSPVTVFERLCVVTHVVKGAAPFVVKQPIIAIEQSSGISLDCFPLAFIALLQRSSLIPVNKSLQDLQLGIQWGIFLCGLGKLPHFLVRASPPGFQLLDMDFSDKKRRGAKRKRSLGDQIDL